MKTKTYVIRLFIWIVSIAGITACSGQQDYPETPDVAKEGIPLSINISRTTTHTTGLEFGLYIFSRYTGNKDSKYQLDSIILPLTERSMLKFSNKKLSQKEYRFLFMATPSDSSALKVVNTHLSTPMPGTSWEDIRIISRSDSISIDNYYQVTDRSAQEILATDTLHAQLKRMVGQLVFRFFKIGENIADLQPIDPEVSSVFDRIKSIRIDYQNFNRILAFDDTGIPYPESTPSSGGQNVSQHIQTVLQNFRLILPQKHLDPINADPVNGGEIKGYCFLPTNQQIRTTLTFIYYDTTPVCGNALHQHNKNCYPQESLTLNIPKKSHPGLSVEANAYTVNKAGIRCNRIIDIGYETNLEIDTDWN